MSTSQIQIPRASNAEIFSFFEKSSIIVGAPSFELDFVGQNNTTNVSVPIKDDQRNIIKESSYSITQARIEIQNFYIHYTRSDTSKGEDYFYDNIKFYNNGTNIGIELLSAIHDLIHDIFNDSPEIVSGLFKNPKLFRDLIASHQRQVVELQKTVASIGRQASEARSQLEKEYFDRKRQLETELDKRRVTLEKEIEQAKSSLSEQENALAERKTALDDRDNTHARRQIRSDLKERLRQYNADLKITNETRSLRWPVHAGVACGLSVIIGLIIYFAYLSTSSQPTAPSIIESISHLLKPVGLTIAALGLGAWYLRWMNRWFERHSELEFQLKQFELDIDRATWVVETALEWRQEQHSTIPNHLLESISRNLFSRSDKDEGSDMHPADYLASALLGKASALRLALPGGRELEYGPRALKEVSKAESK